MTDILDRVLVWSDYDQLNIEWMNSLVEPPTMTAVCLDGKDQAIELDPFIELLFETFGRDIRVASRYVGIWREDSVSDRNPDFCRGFPHVHNNDLVSVSMVVQAPESGGCATLGEEMLAPVAGHGLIICGRELHGVRRVFGPTPRIAVIAQFTWNDFAEVIGNG